MIYVDVLVALALVALVWPVHHCRTCDRRVFAWKLRRHVLEDVERMWGPR